MNEQEQLLQELRDIAKNHKGRIRIVKTNVDANLQLEFYGMLQQFDSEETSDANLQELFAALNQADSNGNVKLQKQILAKITIDGSIEAFRFLEKYLDNCNDNIKNWALLACQQCQMFLESNLLDEPTLFFASGLGGEENRFRYEIIFKNNKDAFNDFQKKILTDEINYYFKKEDAICENIDFVDYYAICTALIPITSNIMQLISDILDEVNKYGNFVTEHFLVTNEKFIDRNDLESLNFPK